MHTSQNTSLSGLWAAAVPVSSSGQVPTWIGAGAAEESIYPEGWQGTLKMIIDKLGAAALLVLLAPVMLAVAIGIKLSSPGPVFFVQGRVGLGGRLFDCLKFRSMVVGAEKQQAALEHLNENDGAAFKLRDDPRVFTFGKWIRALSLDEIPQLINVLQGSMSLIGPRPLPPRDVSRFDDPAYMRRFEVLPGLSGPWQVGGRSSVSFRQWMQIDLRYVDDWSIWWDLAILFKTIPAVLARKGAW
jgi:lipopolysaccharide/colanic/teichoic acid biosynthesis glycosyltransferase